MLSTLRSNQLAFLTLFYLSLALIQVSALPIRIRQNATTVHTVHTTQTIAGPMIETCVVTLTPITDQNGNPAVQEVKECTLAYAVHGPGACATRTPSDPGCTTSTSVSATVTATIGGTPTTTPSPSTATPDPSSGGIDGTNSSTPVTDLPGPTNTSTTLPTSLPPTGSGLIVNGISTVTDTPTTTSSSDNPLTITTRDGSTPGTAAPDATTSSPAGANTSTAEQQASSSASSSFEIPGKKLSVLPIGLGVFAGITVIALIVVGLVTYERTKYRKAFRQRKLEELGGPVGYTPP